MGSQKKKLHFSTTLKNTENTLSDTQEYTELKHELEFEKFKNDTLTKELDNYRERVAFLENELSKSSNSIGELTQIKLLLEHKKEQELIPAEPKAIKKPWWKW